MMTAPKTAIYCRTSTDSADDQIRRCTEYAEGQGQDVQTFVDIASRPDFDRLRKAIAAGEINCVIVADRTRISRNPAEYEAFAQTVEVICLDSPRTYFCWYCSMPNEVRS